MIKLKIKLKIKLIFIYSLIFCFFNYKDSIISIEIIISSNCSDRSPKYLIREIYEQIIKLIPNKNKERINLKISSDKVLILFNKYLLMKEAETECLTAVAKKINNTKCFEIYNNSKLNFKTSNPIKIETNSYFQVNFFINKEYNSKIKYISDHPDIINVNNEGKISVIRPGRTIITISGLDYKNITIKVLSIVKNGLINNYTLDIHNASQYENVMIVAHPDDEILWGGANLLKERYFVVCLTNGYNLVRQNEFKKILKFTDNGGIILNYPDFQENIRDDWSEVKTGILKDLVTILNYKHWKKIVTYGQDGTYGHIHHKKTYEYVTQISKEINKYNILYYFGKYYSKNNIPKNLTRISDKELEFKKKELHIYKSQKAALYKRFFHVLPYENWVLASKS